MKTTQSALPEMTLWAAPNSAFSAKLRCFLLKSGLNVKERFPVEPRYSQEIVQKVGYWVLPVVELEDGVLLQDSTETMLHLEQAGYLERSLLPQTPLLNALAHTLNFFGSDGFLKPGMHFRWSFLTEQKTYLESAFADWLPSNESAAQKRERLNGIMSLFYGYGPMLGITEATKPAIEESWVDCLDILNKHFSVCPYLLGDSPSIADCGLITMLGPHLSRDPVPSQLMRACAPMVSRWVERMNRPEWFDGGFPEMGDNCSDVDKIPPTLLPFLRYLATDVVPEVVATIEGFNRWVVEANVKSGDLLDDAAAPTAHPNFGEITYTLRGQEIKRLAFIDTVYQFQQLLNVLKNMADESRQHFETLMQQCGASDLFVRGPSEMIRYANYRYLLQ